MKKYIDTHRYRYVSTISCNKKIEQKYGVRFARKDMPILTNINEGTVETITLAPIIFLYCYFVHLNIFQ